MAGLEDRTLLTMTSAISVAANTTPSQVEARDFNKDGINDLIELNSSQMSVSVLLGNGDGTFQAGINSSSGGSGRNMAISDFDHDGNLDVVVNHSYTIDVLHGHGDGSFDLPQVYYVGATANDIEVGDFNEDGYDDIVTASFSYGGTSEYYQNTGTGTFLAAKNNSIGPTGYQVEVGDVNGDGHLDLVQSDGSGVVAVLNGSGLGTFTSSKWVRLANSAADLEVSDFDGDGHADLAITDGTTVSVYSGTAASAFQSVAQYVAPGSSRLIVGDINGDSKKDILSNSSYALIGRGDGGFYAPSNYSSAIGSDIALGDINGDGGLDAIATSSVLGGGVNLSINANNDRQLISTATHFQITSDPVATAGVGFSVTITALDDAGNIVTDFQGTVGVSGLPGSIPVSYTFTLADGGTHTIANAAKLYTVGTGSYSVTSPFLPDISGSINVQAGSAAKFNVTAQATSVAGDAATFSVSAFDAYGNAASNYLGTVSFSSTDLQAGLPSSYQFTADDAGTHTFSVILKTAGNQKVTVIDSTGFSGVSTGTTVTAAAAASLTVTTTTGYAGNTNPVTITAKDAYGNVATGYNGVVHLSASDPGTSVSADAALVNGVGVFAVTPTKIGAQAITAVSVDDASVNGSGTLNVTPGQGSRVVATSLGATTAGQVQTTTLTVYDSLGNVSTVFTGYVLVTSSDARIGTQYVYFSAADAGVKTISVAFYTAGSQSVTFSGYSNPSMTTTQVGIQISPSVATSISVTALQGGVAGAAQNFTVTARDAYGNIATSYRGTVGFTSDDSQATLPGNYTFTAADAGSHTFSMTFKSAGGKGLTVTDLANPLMTNTQKDIYITAGVAVTYKIRVQSNVTVGVAFAFTVEAVDAYGNTDTNYRGKVHFSGPSGGGNILPADYTFTGEDAGIHIFSITLASTGTQTIGVQDVLDGKIKAQASVKVVTSTTSTGGGSTGGGGGGGGGGGKKVV